MEIVWKTLNKDASAPVLHWHQALRIYLHLFYWALITRKQKKQLKWNFVLTVVSKSLEWKKHTQKNTNAVNTSSWKTTGKFIKKNEVQIYREQILVALSQFLAYFFSFPHQRKLHFLFAAPNCSIYCQTLISFIFFSWWNLDVRPLKAAAWPCVSRQIWITRLRFHFLPCH